MSLRLREAHRAAAVTVALALLITVSVAGGVLLAQRASAQDAVHTQVSTTAPPTVSATAEYPNAELSWDFDAESITPAGWELELFQVTREDHPGAANFYILPEQSAASRSLTDPLSGKTLEQWLSGFRVKYTVRAIFHNAERDAREPGMEGTFILVVPSTAPVNEVRRAAQPNLTATAQHPSVQLDWTFDAEKSTPRGWRLHGFQLSSADHPSNTNLRILPDASADARSFSDTPSHKTTEQWVEGFQLRYHLRAVFQRVIDNTLQPSAELSIILTVQPTAPKSAVRNTAAPTVSATASYPNVEVSWNYSGASNPPAGWRLAGFQVWRESATQSAEQGGFGSLPNADPDNAVFPVQAPTARSYTDSVDHKSRYDWLDGFNQRYGVRAMFRRDLDNALEPGPRATYILVVQPPVSPQEVMSNYPAPTLTAAAHADGVQLNWTFNEAASTPRGWKLGGFLVSRWIEVGPDKSKRYFYGPPYRAVTDRSFKDTRLDRTPEELRYGGSKINFAVGAMWIRVIDGDRRFAQKTELEFRAPGMPNVQNFRMRWGEQVTQPYTWVNEVVWDRPHLAWDNRFPRVTGYTIYRDGEEIASLGGEVFSYSWQTNTLCDDAQKIEIRAQFGVFFSRLLSPVDQRIAGGIPCTDF